MMGERIHDAVAQVCPIDGVHVGDLLNKATWKVDFRPEATAPQRAAAQTAINNFDTSGAVDAAEAARVAAIRADSTRIDILSRFKTATLADMSTYVDTQIAGGTVTQLRDQSRAMFKRILAAIMLDART